MLDRCFSGVEYSTLEYSTSGAKLHHRELVELEVYGHEPAAGYLPWRLATRVEWVNRDKNTKLLGRLRNGQVGLLLPYP
jgi:hypothetical protein